MAILEDNPDDEKQDGPNSTSKDFPHPVKREQVAAFSKIQPSERKTTSLAPYRGMGLLDKIAGFDKLLPDDSARESVFPSVEERRAWKTPSTIKVKAKGPGRGKDGYSKRAVEDEKIRARNKLQEPASSYHGDELRNDYQRTNGADEAMRGIGKQRKIRPRNSLQGWNSTPAYYPGYSMSIVEPYGGFPAPHRTTSKPAPQDYRSESGYRGAGSGFEYGPPLRFAPATMPFIATSPNQASFHAVFPAPILYESTANAFTHNVWHSREMNLLESLPYVDHDLRQCEEPSRLVDGDDDEIVFLGERRSFTTMDHVGPTWPVTVPGYLAPEQGTECAKTTLSEQMNEVVKLMLIAAEVLDMNESYAAKRETSESITDSSSIDRAVSPAIPASLSPLYTLAKLSTERLRYEGTANQRKTQERTVVDHMPSIKPATSVWIRGGHRSNNKESLASKKKKPYDRPFSKATSKESTGAHTLEWYTDFPEFERQAASRKRSFSSRGSVLSGMASLSNMPLGSVKKVTFGDQVFEGKDPGRMESESTEATVLSSDRLESSRLHNAAPGRQNTSPPAKRRGRPRKVTVKTEEVTSPPGTARAPRSRQDDGEKRVTTTRSGRVVKAVQY